MTSADGLVVVDKPAGWTSHDVVARLRRLAGTRRVGHAGTLDPMATGVLVVGIGRATRLLGYLAAGDKGYDATVRLGETTSTDDAQGEALASVSAVHLQEEAVRAALEPLTGEVAQVPAAVSAIKIGGRPAYARVRAGESVELAPRTVTVSELRLDGVRRAGPCVDVDVHVECSSGTYVRAIARDLGAALGVGGHLTALRRTRVGGYGIQDARPLTDLELELTVLPLAGAVAAAFPRRDVDADDARRIGHGVPLPAVALGPGPVGVFGPDGSVLALVQEGDGLARPLVVFVGS